MSNQIGILELLFASSFYRNFLEDEGENRIITLIEEQNILMQTQNDILLKILSKIEE